MYFIDVLYNDKIEDFGCISFLSSTNFRTMIIKHTEDIQGINQINFKE